MSNKVWTAVAQYDTYEEADAMRNELTEQHNLVKVKCGFDTYRVKVWDPIPEKKKKKKKSTKNAK